MMARAGGAILGLLWGTLIVSIASSMGATLAFLSSRFLFREAVRNRFGDRLRAIDAGLEKEGAFYLFALRLAPVFPFVPVDLLMRLTPIRTPAIDSVIPKGMHASPIAHVYALTPL